MQHAPHREIVDVDVASGAFGRHVRPWQGLADDSVSGGILERRLGIDLEIEVAFSDQICKANAGPTCFRPYLAIRHDEVIGPGAEALGRELDERLARGRSCLPNLHAAALDATRP